MTDRDTKRRIARALQRVCVDESGRAPSYTACLRVVDEHHDAARRAGFIRREHVAVWLYEQHRAVLVLSADAREARRQEMGR